jgi:hypothetical protein
MTLKEFVEQMFERSPFYALETAKTLIELQAIEQHLNLIWGVELEITVKEAPRQQGKWYGKHTIKALQEEVNKRSYKTKS